MKSKFILCWLRLCSLVQAVLSTLSSSMHLPLWCFFLKNVSSLSGSYSLSAHSSTEVSELWKESIWWMPYRDKHSIVVFLYSVPWPVVRCCVNHHLLNKEFLWSSLRDVLIHGYKSKPTGLNLILRYLAE